MYPENPEGIQVILGSMNMGYISDTARNRTHDLFHPKREPIPLGHSDGLCGPILDVVVTSSVSIFFTIIGFDKILLHIDFKTCCNAVVVGFRGSVKNLEAKSYSNV